MKENSIGCIPPGGYRKRQNNSIKCLQWFQLMEENDFIANKHFFRSVLHPLGEVSVHGRYVDGYDELTGGKLVIIIIIIIGI